MRRILLLIPLLLISLTAGANPSGINISGKIALQADNSALNSSTVNFRVRVLSPLGCVLYVENFPGQDLSNTSGVFNLTIGTGTAAFNAWDAVLATANSKASLLKVFSNGSTAIPSGLQTMGTEPCTGSYSPADGDVRRIVIEFDPAGGASYVALYPYHTIRSVPYAMLADHATDTDKLGGVPAAQYAKTADLATAVPGAETNPGVEAFAKTPITGLSGGACGAGKVLSFDGTQLTCVTDGGASTVLSPATDTVLGGVMVPSASYVSIDGSGNVDVKNLPTSKITGLDAALASKFDTTQMPAGGCGAGEALVWQSPSNTFDCYLLQLTASQITDFNTAVDARVNAGAFLPTAGGTMTGDITMSGAGTDLNMGNNIVANIGYLHMENKAADPGSATNGYVWYNATSKLLKFYDGTATRTLPAVTGACADTQVLKYDSGSSSWICANDVGASGGVDASTIQGADVDATAPAVGQFMKFVGTKWTPTSMPVCTADQVMLFNASGVATCTAISGLTDSAIAAGAAIGRSKIAGGTPGHVVINDGTGALSSEAQLAVTRGGTGIAGAYTDGQLLIGKTDGTLAKSTLTQGSGITITNGDGTITIAASSVGSSGIADDSIMNVDINSAAAIDRSKLANGTPNTLVVNDGTGVMVSATAITGDRALISNASGIPVASAVTNTELGYVSGVTSAIQTQLDGKLNLSGGTMTGAIAMGGNNITNTGDITMAASKAFGLSAFAADPGSPIVGQVWYNSTDKVIRYYDGAVKTLGVSGAGLQSLNGLIDSAQSFATSTAGGTFGFNSVAGVHTLNIPIADGTKDGLLSSANYTAFNNKLSAVSNAASLADGKVWIGDGTGKAQERTISGAITVDNTGVATLATVAINKGGTGATDAATAYKNLSPLAAKGDLVTHDGTSPVVLNVGTTGQALVADSSAPNGIKWGDIFATDLLNLVTTGIVQRNGAGSYSTVTVNSPLTYSAGALGVGGELAGLNSLSANGYVKRTGAATYGVTTGDSAATASTVVERDSSGIAAFSGVKITNGTTNITQNTTSGGSTYAMTWPNALPVASGKVLSVDTSGNLTWIDALTGNVTSANITDGTIVDADISATAAIARTKLANGTANTLVINGVGGAMSEAAAINPNVALISDANGIPTHSAVTATELGYVSGVTSSIQTQLTGKLNLSGGTMTGAIAMGGNNITNTGDITMAASKTFGLSAFAADPGSPIVGQVWYNSTDKVVRYYDGAVKTLGVSGAGLQSLNGLNDNAQSFATSTAGGTLGFTSAAGVHTLNIPIADGTKDGLLSSANYTAFNSKLSAVSNTATLADGKVWIGDASNKAQEHSISGAITIDNTGVATLATVAIAKGGTGATDAATAFKNLSPMTTKGDLIVHDGTAPTRLAVSATQGQALVVDSAAPNGVKWGDVYATDLANITGLGIVQKTAAGTYVTLGVTSPLAIVGSNIQVGTELTGLSGLSSNGYVKRTGAGTYSSVTGNAAASNSTLVERDGSGVSGFNGVTLTNGSGNMTQSLAAGGSTTFTVTWPNALPGAGGKVLSSDASGNLSWIDVLTGSVTSAQITDGTIVDADISATAAIARTKLADGTNANRLLINDGTKKMAEAAAINPSVALISDANGIPTHSAVTATELGYLSGVTSSVQTQLTGKVSIAGDAMTGNLTMNAQKEVRFADSDSSNYVGLRSPATVTADKVWTLPAADGGAGQALKTDGAGNLGWVTLPAGAVDSDYGVKGIVGFDTDAATSGMSYTTAGIAKVNAGVGANQIVKLDASSKLPAVDGSALTHLDVSHIDSASGKYFSYMPNGTECADGEVLKWVAATDRWVCGSLSSMAVTSVVAGTGISVNTVSGAATVSVSTELAGVHGLATTGYVQRTGAGTYSTTAGNTLNSNSTVVLRDGSGVSGFSGVALNNGSMNVTQAAPAAGTSYTVTWPNSAPASNGYVLSSTTAGVMSWVAQPSADNLGNHTATQNIQLNSHWLSGDGGNEGVYVTSAGYVGIGTSTPAGIFEVQGGTAAANTDGTHIAINAQNGGSGGAVGGSIFLNPGDGTAGWPGGTVRIATTDGQDGAITVGNNTTTNYTSSSGIKTSPAYTINMSNSYNLNNSGALLQASIRNSSNTYQEGYLGFISVSGASTYSPDFVLGMQSTSNGYQERLKILGSNGNVGIGVSTPATKLEVNGGVRIGTEVTACAAGLAGTLRYNSPNVEFCNGTAWTAFGTGSGSGTVTTVTSANGDITIANNTTTPQLTLNSGTTGGAGDANKIAKLDASGLIATAMLPSVTVAKGGTGLSGGTSGGIPYFNSATTMASSGVLAANGVVLGGGAGTAPTTTTAGTADQVLRVPAGGGAPAFGAIDLTKSAAVTGSLAITNGGTGSSTAAGARTNLGLGTAAVVDTGSAAGNIPVLGVGGLVANKVCVSDGTASGIICNSNSVSALDDLSDVYYSATYKSLYMGGGTPQTGTNTDNLAVGHSAMSALTTGTANVALGTETLKSVTSGNENVAVGWQSLYGITTGSYNVAIGGEAMIGVTNGQSNAGVGNMVLTSLTSGSNNVALGECAGCNITSGGFNVAIGTNAGKYTSTGSNNIYIGANSGKSSNAQVRNNNVIIGDSAANAMTTGSDNVVLGYNNAQALTTGTRNIVIGSNINMASGTATNTLNVGNLIFGTGVDGTGTTLSAGKIGIGVTAPATKLEVNGGIRMGTEATACAAGLAGTLRYNSPNVEFCNGTAWTAFGTGSGSGTVTTVSSANGDITVANATTTPQLTLNSGTAGGAGDANKIAKLDASGLLATAMLPSVTVAKGGTGLSGGTSGGIPYFNSATTMASSGALTANGVVLGGGAGSSPTSTAAGAAYSVLRVPSGGGAPAFGAIDISQSAAVTGVLPIANGGTGGSSLPAANNLLMSNGTGIVSAGSCTLGQTLYYTGSTWACSTDFVAANVASAVNYLILNGSTGTSTVKLTAGGTATNLDITINGKGTGSIVLGDSTGSATAVRTDRTLNVNATYTERAPASATGSATIPTTTNIYRHALTNAATSTLTLPACPASGANAFSMTIKVTQGSLGTGVLAWAVSGTTMEWDSATEPTMTTTANKDSIYQFICIGDENKWYGMQVWKYQ